MKIDELVTTARDAVSVRKVFAEPIEKDGIMIIPAALVSGGGGGGHGYDQHGQEGEGGGFGVGARPVGVYVLKGTEVRWLPAVDVNRLLAVLGAVAVAFLLSRARIHKAWATLRESSGAGT
jgi:uncharacterized spore protein YtfJ